VQSLILEIFLRIGGDTKINMLTMYKQITIKTLINQGVKRTEVARQLGCHRNTVSNILQRDTLIEKSSRQKGSLFDPYHNQIKEWLEGKITNLRIFEILRDDHGVDSTYVNVCKYIQKHFPKPKPAFGVQTTTPGEVAEIDFGYLGMFPGSAGTLVKTYGLAVILAYSRIGFYTICYDQKLETLISGLSQAFDYFGGVPLRMKVDNMRTAILTNQHYDLQFNQDFLEFAYHFNTVITPCTPYHPEQKGIVESGIKYLQQNFIAGRTFASETDLRQQLHHWMDTYANIRIHGTTRLKPAELFEKEEKDKLQSLPSTTFAFFNRGVRKVGSNCHVHFSNNYYSVSSVLVGKEVTIRWNNSLLRIIYQGEQVAFHLLSHGQGQYVTCRSHLPDYKTYSATEFQARFEVQFADMGEAAHSYFKMLLAQEPYWFRIVRSLLGLRQQYGNEALNLSLKRALHYGVRDVTIVKNILTKKLYTAETEPRLLDVAESSINQGDWIRDLHYYTDSTVSESNFNSSV